ncbi:hypothetical protein JHK85_018494 [Glycine max]|uniref:Transmembrane protein n=1 Tax=Glycine soja TaxID=3848 RepID=A0A0B2SJV7_GLYSO|nr:hypothetical protein JHK85_018494 [Glycine max]KHN44592.1 hypothetical protein glysoja_027203 [Glycine soja]RZC02238.1 hypothetical protein D0Y65_017404 [Glycine soja]
MKQCCYDNFVSAFNIHWEMARTRLCSISVPFLILLIIVFTFFAQITPINSADMKMRKLGLLPSPPPQPIVSPGPEVH